MMDALAIKLWVKNLGLGFTELVAEGKIPNQPLVKSFEDSNWPTMQPVEGVELLFSDTTTSLKQILITLIPTVGQPVYAGGLPSPFSLMINQQSVRSALGEPMDSRGRARLPGGLGIRGGWDAYKLFSEWHPNAKVIIGYLENYAVNNISFSLINEEGLAQPYSVELRGMSQLVQFISSQILLRQPLHRQPPIVRRRHPLELLKPPIEVGNIIEPRLKAHIRHRLVPIGQQFTGLADAQPIDEFNKSAPGRLFEHPGKIRWLHPQVLRHFFQRQLSGVVGKDVVHRAVGAVDAVFVGLLWRGDAGEQLVVVTGAQHFQQNEKVPQARHALGLFNALHQGHGLGDGFFAAEFDAVLRTFQQRRQALEFGKRMAALLEQLIGEVHQHVALGHDFAFLYLADPVVGQVGAGEEQAFGVEVTDVVADKHLARAGDDKVQLVFLVEVPAHQRAGEAVLAIDDGQAVVVVHQLVGRVGDTRCSGHAAVALLWLRPE